MTDSLINEAAQRLERRVSPTTPIRTELNVSFEFFPPASKDGFIALQDSAAQLAPFDPSFVSVTYGAGGSSQDKTFAALDMLANTTDLSVAGHLTCVAADKSTIDTVVDGYVASGVNRIVALRGDAPADAKDCGADGRHPDGYCDAAELVAAIRQRSDADNIDISVAAYPEVHPKAASAKSDMDNLKRKIDAGADRALTQFFFNTEAFLRFLDDARAAGITAPIVPGIMPVTNFAGIKRFSAGCGTVIPDWMEELFADLDDVPSVRKMVAATVAAEQCKLLMEHGVRDFHFYTMNKPDLTAAVCRILGLTPKASAVAAPNPAAASTATANKGAAAS